MARARGSTSSNWQNWQTQSLADLNSDRRPELVDPNFDLSTSILRINNTRINNTRINNTRINAGYINAARINQRGKQPLAIMIIGSIG